MRRLNVVPLLVVLVAAAAVGCGDDDDATQSSMSVPDAASSSEPATTSSSTTTSSTTTTAATTTSSAGATAPTLPPDDRPRTPPADALADLGGLPGQASFEALAGEVVRVLEERFPAEEPNQSTASSAAASGAAGTVAFRVDGLADDSLAGWDYTVQAAESGGAWAVTAASKVAICRRGVSGGLCT
ncbi:MAG: hypothetical protein GEV08_24310 [Acidimicrobiia bacterium]|nr:hypothetical protein [Acidimicrobiia bacterium]